MQVVNWEGLRSKAPHYRAILCDIWGVVHNGVRAHQDALVALRRYRAQGGRVLLISNAPRPAASVQRQLENMGVEENCYDAILTSGDLTKSILEEESFGHYCYHLGPERDLGLFENGKTERVGLSEAQFILCTGLEDDLTQRAEDYQPLLEIAFGRGLKMVCANPDIIVERDGKIIPCAGAVAQLYERLGGEVIHFGKPHAPIYDRAVAHLQQKTDGVLGSKNILAIGDGLLTDIQGAITQGFDSLFILGGIATDIGKDSQAVQAFCQQRGIYPTAFMSSLYW